MTLVILLILSYFTITKLANRWTRSEMEELGTINAMPGGFGNTNTSSTFIKPVIMFLNFTDNLFNSLRLPLSSYCLQTHYTNNHNKVNAKTLGMTSRHYLTISLYFFLIGFTCLIHTLIILYDDSYVFFDHLPSNRSAARLALRILTMTSPFFVFLSLMLCWFYLSGNQFAANLHFLWMKDYQENCGVWEDLGPANFSFKDFIGINDVQFPRIF